MDPGEAVPTTREEAERDLCLTGLVSLVDLPRPEVADAVARCHTAGIRILVVTGDHGLTAAAVARRPARGTNPRVITGAELEAMPEPGLDRLLREGEELIFARTRRRPSCGSPTPCRRRATVMTGDGGTTLQRSEGLTSASPWAISGTDVACESATMILTDDNFASIVGAVEEGRRVYANIRKFILYIFAHAPAEVVPFLAFKASGGAPPLPSPRADLAIDPTETLPALGPRPGRGRHRSGRRVAATMPIIDRGLAGAGLGLPRTGLAVLVMGGFLYAAASGMHLGDDVRTGSPLHHAVHPGDDDELPGHRGHSSARRSPPGPIGYSLRSIGFFCQLLPPCGRVRARFAAAVIYVPALAGRVRHGSASARSGPVHRAVR